MEEKKEKIGRKKERKKEGKENRNKINKEGRVKDTKIINQIMVLLTTITQLMKYYDSSFQKRQS